MFVRKKITSQHPLQEIRKTAAVTSSLELYEWKNLLFQLQQKIIASGV